MTRESRAQFTRIFNSDCLVEINLRIGPSPSRPCPHCVNRSLGYITTPRVWRGCRCVKAYSMR